MCAVLLMEEIPNNHRLDVKDLVNTEINYRPTSTGAAAGFLNHQQYYSKKKVENSMH